MGYTAASTYEYMRCPECLHGEEMKIEATKEEQPKIEEVVESDIVDVVMTEAPANNVAEVPTTSKTEIQAV